MTRVASPSRNGHITNSQRFKGDHRCPICDGAEDDPRGQARRCRGFLSGDGKFAHCSREEHAGRTAFNPVTETYPHLLKGKCPCGTEHAPADPEPPRPKRKASKARRTVDKVYAYRDERGQVLFEAVRYRDPKGFSQRVPLGDGKYAYNLGDVRKLLYRLPELIEADPDDLVVIVEGEKDVDRLRALEFIATCNPMGAGKWRPEYSEWLRGRRVAILPDNDQPGRDHAERVARSLEGIAAEVKVVELPNLPEGGDVSDFLDGGGSVDQLGVMLFKAPPRVPGPPIAVATGGKPLEPNEAEDDPHRLARVYLDRNRHPDGLTLRYWREEWHRWDGTSYRPTPDKEVRGELASSIKAEYDRLNIEAQKNHSGDRAPPVVRAVTTKKVADVMQALSSLALLRVKDCPSSPAWIEKGPPWSASETMPTRNALVHMPSLVEGRPCTARPTPAFFCPYALDFDFNPKAPPPREWLHFLSELWGDDEQSIGLLQEWFGYLLTADTSAQKMLMLIGPRRSGKGTIARMLTAMIGAENVANPTLSQLSTDFGAASLIGKTAAIIADARLSGRVDQAVIVERLLSITGEDSQSIARKYREDWQGKLPTRFLLISNVLPRLNDSSAALPGRMMVLQLTRSFFGNEDRNLSRRLLAELPGILMWSVEGWRRLRARGRFEQPTSAADLADEMETLASPHTMFMRERLTQDPAEETPTAAIYSAWKEWCQSKGMEHPGDEQNLGRNLRTVIPGLKSHQTRINGRPVRVYRGIGLSVDF